LKNDSNPIVMNKLTAINKKKKEAKKKKA